MRRAVKLRIFRCSIEAIAGEVNNFADLLTRWAVRPRFTISRLARLVTVPISLSPSKSMTGSISTLSKNVQLAADEPMPQERTVDSEGFARYQSQAVWIPDGDSALQLPLLIVAHTGPGGHRGIVSTGKQ
jgi:hypothetical protein